MKSWFKKRSSDNYPHFWKSYSTRFREALPALAHDTTFVVFDTETTGLDPDKDRILSVGAVKIYKGRIKVKDTLELYTRQDRFNPESVPIHGIVNHPKHQLVSELEMLERFLDYIENSPLVAHHAGFDITMINKALHRNGLPPLKNKSIDTMRFYRRGLIISNFVDRDKNFSLDEVAEKLGVPLKDRHTAPGDAFITALVFLKLWHKWEHHKNLKTSSLLKVQ